MPEDGSAISFPVAIIPNAGFVHHVGPFRLHVYLARALLAAGIASLRFDLSGLGDSVLPEDRKQVSERKNADLTDAMDFVGGKLDSPRFVMLGLCSGANDSHRVALVDPRVAGVAMIEPPAYPNKEFFLRKALNPLRVMRVLARVIRQRRSPAADEAENAAPIHQPQPAAEFAAEIERNTLQGTRYLFIYLNRQDYNHRRQLYSILSRATPRSHVNVIFEPAFDHTLIFESDRVAVTKHIARWMLQQAEDDKAWKAA